MRIGAQAIEVGVRPLDDYAAVAGAKQVERARAAGARVAGARVLHVTAVGSSERVPELLRSLLPLARGAGVEAEWRVLFGDAAFRVLARACQDGVQGAETALTDGDWADYLTACEGAAASLEGPWDAVVLHDPQALGLATVARGEDEPLGGRLVWRCHLDASEPDPPLWERLAPLARRCEEHVFSLASFAPADVAASPADAGVPAGAAVRAVAPAIDPLSPANVEPPIRLAGSAVRALGVDLSRPFCCQAARLDPWKDPHETIDAFALAKEELPELQLVLAGALPADDREGWPVLKEITDYAEGRADVHVLTGYTGVGTAELSALRRLARVAVHKSIREGFGLGAAEALWQGTPVVGSATGGLPLQVRDGVDGYLAAAADETARRLVELVRDPALAIEMGASGRQRVRERFLVPRLLADDLELLDAVLSAEPGAVGDPATVEP